MSNGTRWDGLSDHDEARTPNGCLRWNTVDAAFQLNPGDDRHDDRIIECSDLGGHVRVAIPQMDRDIRIDQIRQA